MFGLPSLLDTNSLKTLGANSTQNTLPPEQMSDTCEGVVPVDAPR